MVIGPGSLPHYFPCCRSSAISYSASYFKTDKPVSRQAENRQGTAGKGKTEAFEPAVYPWTAQSDGLDLYTRSPGGPFQFFFKCIFQRPGFHPLPGVHYRDYLALPQFLLGGGVLKKEADPLDFSSGKTLIAI